MRLIKTFFKLRKSTSRTNCCFDHGGISPVRFAQPSPWAEGGREGNRGDSPRLERVLREDQLIILRRFSSRVRAVCICIIANAPHLWHSRWKSSENAGTELISARIWSALHFCLTSFSCTFPPSRRGQSGAAVSR